MTLSPILMYNGENVLVTIIICASWFEARLPMTRTGFVNNTVTVVSASLMRRGHLNNVTGFVRTLCALGQSSALR